jgi:hypothetical protein
MSQTPPPHVAQAASVVNEWLAKAEGRLSDADHAKLSNAEKLDYARRFDQSKMPPNPYDTGHANHRAARA